MSWDELVAAALIGTDRRPVEASVPDGAPSGLAEALALRGAEERLLGAAAVWTVARRAGALAGPPTAVASSPSDADARPLAPGMRLRMMLEGTFPSLLPEWLELVAQRELRPPPELVPALLDHVARDPSLHAAAGAAAGPLGWWLAARAPRWAFVRGAGDDAAKVWAEGERAERRALLDRLRTVDPAAARDLLASTFAEETWEDRAAFVATLAVGLSDGDEPLLETALHDRRKPVRDAAVELLVRLPRSRFAARMAARTAPLLRAKDDLLLATLPDTPDAAAARDGVPAGGRRSERLRWMLAATPLATWAAGADAGSPRDLVALAVRDDLGDVVHAGWVAAAIAQRDAEWARALWHVRPEPALLRALPDEDAQRLAAQAPDPDLAARALPRPWGPELSTAAIGAIERRRTAGERGQDVAFAGHRLDPALAAEAEARLRDLGGRDLWVLCDILSARAAMLRELS